MQHTAPLHSGIHVLEMVRSLESLSYLERRIELKKPHYDYPRFIYKYRALGNEEEVHHLRSYLIDSTMYLNSPKNFNDPFDIKGNIVFEPDIGKLRYQFDKELKKHHPNLAPDQRALEVSRLLKDKGNQKRFKKDGIQNATKDFGVCSFTTDPRNILMWSHYGRHHKGIALQFECARDPARFLHALPLEYSNRCSIVHYPSGPDKTEELHNLIKIKHCGWAYEQERRIIHPDKAGTHHPFNPAALTGIIFGCRTDEQTEERVRGMIAEREKQSLGCIKIYRAMEHESEYRLDLISDRSIRT